MVRFDLSQINKSATIDSAKLEMFVEAVIGYETATANLYAVSKNWKEKEANWFNADNNTAWNMAGGDYASTIIDSCPISSSDTKKWQSFNVTTPVKKFVKIPENNFGFFIYMTMVILTSEYSASQSTTTANRPKLTIYYSETGVTNNNLRKSPDLFELKHVSGSYLINIPFSGNYRVGIYDVKGVLLASAVTTQSNLWYRLPSLIQPGIHLVRISGNERNIVKKMRLVK